MVSFELGPWGVWVEAQKNNQMLCSEIIVKREWLTKHHQSLVPQKYTPGPCENVATHVISDSDKITLRLHTLNRYFYTLCKTMKMWKISET